MTTCINSVTYASVNTRYITETQQYNLQIVKFFAATRNYNLLLLKCKPLAILHPNNFLKPSPDRTFSLFVLPF